MTQFQMEQIKYLRMQGCSYTTIAEEHQLPCEQVKSYCKGKTWDDYKRLIEESKLKNTVRSRAKKTA